jgi:hypothetical protein
MSELVPAVVNRPRDPGDVGRSIAGAGLGAIALVAGALRGDKPKPAPDATPTASAVAAGVVVETSALAAKVVHAAASATVHAKHVFDAVAPNAVTSAIDGRIRHLGEIGATTAEVGKGELLDGVSKVMMPVLDPILDNVLPTVLDRLGGQQFKEPMLNLVESIVGEVMQPVLETALPLAVDKLTEDPAPVRELVWGQGVGMAGEARTRTQDVARTVDDRVDTIMERLRLRRRRPAGTP